MNEIIAKLDRLDEITAAGAPSYEDLAMILNATPGLVRRLRAVIYLAEELDDETANRIRYVIGGGTK